ncbi:MAG TPA: GNAT family N-acetyltransferase, partial [Cupriavidus sp.]|nr:GNAT family N-acetyltransferase [Cupriavidus sp.]
DSFDDPFPGTDIMVTIRRVTWNEVPVLVSRLRSSPR